MGVLIYQFYKHAYTNPDEAGCWVGDLPGSGTRVVAPAEFLDTDPRITLTNAVNVGKNFELWFEMGFFYYVINLVLLIFATIGLLIKNAALANIGKALCCFSFAFFLGWVIMGSIWRWGPDGTLASCRKLKCIDPATGEPRFNEEDDALGTGYQIQSGWFMNAVLWILYVPLACCVICLPIALCTAMSR